MIFHFVIALFLFSHMLNDKVLLVVKASLLKRAAQKLQEIHHLERL